VVLAGHSGKAITNYHYINGISLVDLNSEVEETYEKTGEKFSQEGVDLMEIKGDHFKNASLIRESYNRQLIRQANQYSALVARFIKNAELELQVLAKFPS